MRNKQFGIYIICAVAALFWGSCRRVDDVVWSKYISIPEDGWDPMNVLPFYPWPVDSVNNPQDRYSLLLSVRFHEDKCPAPLHLIVIQEDDNGMSRRDTVRMDIRIPKTGPAGKGSYSIFEQSDTILRNIRLTPGYSVELQSLSYSTNTAGLREIGLILSLDNHIRTKTFFKLNY
ncbi:MAG: gliding motility lipoprotein GldH [Bacteroidales bacterium]|nr:gliding motility lipoprotein GldH [Bacteroidales bacterium]